MQAYVLIGAKSNKEESIYKKIKAMPEVREINLLFGSWDLIAKVEVKDVATLNEFMLNKVRKINDVTLTATMIVAK